MPAAHNHWQFCLKALNKKPGFSGPETLGTQGPDPFFFYGMVPWRKRHYASRVHEFGTWLHNARPVDVLAPLIQSALSITDPSLDLAESAHKNCIKNTKLGSLAFRFVKGMLFHYILDKTIHPWVYWSIGFDNESNPDPLSRIRHARFEGALATLGLVPQENKTLSIQNPKIMLNANPNWLNIADNLFSLAFPNFYEKGMYQASFIDMKTALLFTWDPLSIKRKILDFFGAKNTLPRAILLPVTNKEFERRDYRNEKKEAWLMPSTGKKQSESTMDLVQKALDEAKKASKHLYEIEHEKINSTGSSKTKNTNYEANIKELMKLFNDLNHEGCAPNEEMKHWNTSFYKKDS